MLLAIAGRFPGDYKDGRYTTDADKVGQNGALHFDTVRDKFTQNLGRMPIAVVNGSSVGQSVAINYLIASECKMLGNNAMETARILAIQEHLKEMMLAYRQLIPYGTAPTEEQLKTWFETGAEDKSPAAADASVRKTRYNKWWLGRIEACIGEGGFAVGNSLSLADVLLYNTLAE